MWQSGEFRAPDRDFLGNLDIREEPVAAPSNGFHKAGTLGGVPEGLTDFTDRFVEPVVEIHKSVGGPEFFLKFLAGYDLAGVPNEHREDLEGLFLKANSEAMLAQFAGAKIQLENPKAEPHAKVKVFLHKEVMPSETECITWQDFTGTGGHHPVSLLKSDGYQGTLTPEGENCPSIELFQRQSIVRSYESADPSEGGLLV
jgi:hypothetical protein